MKVLLTNDDGIQATGLHAMRRALLEVPGVELATIAPDSNRSATARSITTRSPLWVDEVELGDGTVGYATDGTPVDCVRFAALEGIVLGVPAIAVSQQADHGAMDFRIGRSWEPENFAAVAAFVARIVEELSEVPMPEGTLLNVNAPAGDVAGVSACRLGKRIYRDTLELAEEEGGRRRYRIYGESPGYHPEDGTDFAAIADGRIAVTPLHFDLTDRAAVETLAGFDFDRLLGPAAKEV